MRTKTTLAVRLVTRVDSPKTLVETVGPLREPLTHAICVGEPVLHGIPCDYPLLTCLPVAILVSDHFMCFSEGIGCSRAPSLSSLISYVHVYEYNHTQIIETPEHAIQLLDVEYPQSMS